MKKNNKYMRKKNYRNVNRYPLSDKSNTINFEDSIEKSPYTAKSGRNCSRFNLSKNKNIDQSSAKEVPHTPNCYVRLDYCPKVICTVEIEKLNKENKTLDESFVTDKEKLIRNENDKTENEANKLTVKSCGKKFSNQVSHQTTLKMIDDSPEKEVRPSQVYEFSFNPKKEVQLKKNSKKEAKIIKQMIKKKQKDIVHDKSIMLGHSNKSKATEAKQSKNENIQLNSTVETIKEKVTGENISVNKTKSPVNELKKNSNYNNTQLPTKIDENNILKQIKSSGNCSLNEINILSPVNRSGFKQSHSTPYQNSFIMNNESVNNFSLIETHANDEIINHSPDSNKVDEMSQICNDFDQIYSEPPMKKDTKSNPWRPSLPFSSKQLFFDVKRSSLLPSYNQDITIKSFDMSVLNDSKESVIDASHTNDKNLRQSSILSFVNNATQVQFVNEGESSLFDGDIMKSPKYVKQSLKLADDTNEENENSSLEISMENNASSSMENSKSPRKVLGEKNVIPKVSITYSRRKNKSFSNKENIINYIPKKQKSPSKTGKKITEESIYMPIEGFLESDVFHESNSIKRKLPEPSTSKQVIHSTIENFYGFDDDNDSISDEIPNKKPCRVNLMDIAAIVKNQKPKLELTSKERAENKNDDDDDQSNNKQDIVFDDSNSDSSANEDENLEDNENINPDFQLFDEPRYTLVEQKRYTDIINKKNKRTKNNNDKSGSTKRRKIGMDKKEEVEFEKWAQQFNSFCEEVEKENLIVE